MSQFKIWNVIKERRAKKDGERVREDEVHNQLEEAVGRNIEESNKRDMAQWEATYGGKDPRKMHADSGVGSLIESLHKRSASMRDGEMHDLEMGDLGGVAPKRSSEPERRPMVTVRIASDDESQEPPTQSEENLLNKTAISQSVSPRSSPWESHRTSMDHQDATSARDWSQTLLVAAGPTVVPLPFSVPNLSLIHI